MPFFFNGRLWTTPAVMTAIDDSQMANQNLAVGNVLAILGKSEGGKPATALRFGSPMQAREVLRAGESLTAVEKAFDPSAETTGPSEVIFFRVNPATQSTLALKNGSAVDVITLTSTGYGKFTNQIKVKVESGSTAGKKLTTQFGEDYYTEDDVAREAFSLQYAGTGTGTMEITASTLTLTLNSVPTAIALADYPTMAQLVDRLNTVSGITATLLDSNGNRATEAGLDGVTAGQDIKTTLYTARADLQAIIDWFNGLSEGFLDAVRITNALTLPANVAFTYLAGGSEGTTTNTEWQDAFDALQAEDVQWVVPVTPTASIHAMADTHCAYMSNIARMERRAIVGCASGTTDIAATALAKALNSDRISLTHLGLYEFDSTGALVLMEPYIMAAVIAGAFAGVNPGTPLTHKTIKIRGIERKLKNPTDTDVLIRGGVLCVEETNTGFRVVKSITTWLTNRNYNRVEVSTGVAADYTARSARIALDSLLGNKGSPIALAKAISKTETILMELSRPEPAGVAVLVGDAENPPFKNITASITGDVLAVSFECSPVIPINYIPITIHAVPWKGTIAA